MDDIEKMQYVNLRKSFNDNLVDPILGKNYYNMSMDVYGADTETTLDLKRKFDDLNNDIIFYRCVSIITSIVLILVSIFK